MSLKKNTSLIILISIIVMAVIAVFVFYIGNDIVKDNEMIARIVECGWFPPLFILLLGVLISWTLFRKKVL